MILDYNQQSTFTMSLDIVDIGNIALRASNDSGEDYYIALKTSLGKTTIVKFGPLLADMNTLFEDFSLFFQKIDYKEQTIMKILNNFVNDNKKKITSVVEITESELFSSIPQIDSCFYGE